MEAKGGSTTLRAGIAAGLIACLILFGGLWALNNTRVGLKMRCEVFNDVGACFTYALTEPIIPQAPVVQATEDPATKEERERQAAAAEVQRKADAAVAEAVSDLEWAVEALANVANDAADEAEALGDPTDELRQAVEDERAVMEELADMIAAGPTDEFWTDDVSFKLDDVSFARDDVDFARDGVEFSSYALDDARTQRDKLAADVRAAIAALESAQRRYPDAKPPSHSASWAEGELQRLLASIEDSLTTYDAALAEVSDLMDEADAILDQATDLAASVGAA